MFHSAHDLTGDLAGSWNMLTDKHQQKKSNPKLETPEPTDRQTRQGRPGKLSQTLSEATRHQLAPPTKEA
jgi:hypothetical protein